MFAVATASLLTLVQQLSGTPYISGGTTAAGTDCSGLVSFVTTAATGRPIYGDRFNTGNIEAPSRRVASSTAPSRALSMSAGTAATPLRPCPTARRSRPARAAACGSAAEAPPRGSSPSTCISSWQRMRRHHRRSPCPSVCCHHRPLTRRLPRASSCPSPWTHSCLRASRNRGRAQLGLDCT